MNERRGEGDMTSKPTFISLWDQADRENPHDPIARGVRYRELMVEHGFIVKREPGQSVNLPCGWPHKPEPEDVR